MSTPKLWIVSRRAPMRGLDRKVYVERWAILASSGDEAIDRIKLAQGADLVAEEPGLAQYLDGVWKAEVDDDEYVGLGMYSVQPTDADRATKLIQRRPMLRSSRKVHQ